jgi:hypothetical protein
VGIFPYILSTLPPTLALLLTSFDPVKPVIANQDSTTLKTGPSFGGAWQGGKAKGQPPGQYLTWRISFNDLPIKKQMLALKYHRVYEIREIP